MKNKKGVTMKNLNNKQRLNQSFTSWIPSLSIILTIVLAITFILLSVDFFADLVNMIEVTNFQRR